MIQKLDYINCQLLLSQNYIGYLSYIYNNKPHVVPITYFFDVTHKAILGYSGNGHKTKALRIKNETSLVVTEIDSINHWKSVIIQGTYHEFEGSTAKIKLHHFSEGVKEVIRKKHNRDPKFISEFSSKIFKEGPPIVFKINIESITGRLRNF